MKKIILVLILFFVIINFCYGDSCNQKMLAYPNALSPIKYEKNMQTFPKTKDNLVKIFPSNKVYMIPEMKIDPEDVGKNAKLGFYVEIKSLNFSLIRYKNVKLDEIQKFDFFPNPIDFSKLENMSIDIYFGYYIDNELKFNCYEIQVEKCAQENFQDSCSSLAEEQCNNNESCIAIYDFMGNFKECKLNCTQFQNKDDCLSAFNGNSCEWNPLFNFCKLKEND